VKTLLKSMGAIALSVAAIAGAVSLSGCGGSDAMAASAPTQSQVVPTTVILVHGAWADGSSWSKVIPLLQQKGLKVVAVQLARKSLADDADTVRRAVAAQTNQVVLVGHSYGGAVITEAGTDVKVAAMVYVSAFAPNDGQSIADMTSPYPAGAWMKGLVVDSAGFLSLDAATVASSFAPDVSAADQALLTSTQGPIFNHVLQDKVTTAAWKNKKTWWVYGDADQIIPAQFQVAEAGQIKAHVNTISGGSHVSLISHPTEVAASILSAVTDVGGL